MVIREDCERVRAAWATRRTEGRRSARTGQSTDQTGTARSSVAGQSNVGRINDRTAAPTSKTSTDHQGQRLIWPITDSLPIEE